MKRKVSFQARCAILLYLETDRLHNEIAEGAFDFVKPVAIRDVYVYFCVHHRRTYRKRRGGSLLGKIATTDSHQHPSANESILSLTRSLSLDLSLMSTLFSDSYFPNACARTPWSPLLGSPRSVPLG